MRNKGWEGLHLTRKTFMLKLYAIEENVVHEMYD